jgi:hypothetical protein
LRLHTCTEFRYNIPFFCQEQFPGLSSKFTPNFIIEGIERQNLSVGD